ncbi:hypothetical protein FACI_IFERC00001G0815 [Ferroplasma acidarmanus Fer1]|uniref:Uncharacterized protein n=1 Tax=Ferroplasma acidarmanus Fer1 TaxID=333146 RepID=S0ART4_FERAC|nr:hypothetical protein FACI_IFERC00001G0815 [Ferroplasma acidarmanus Fer1]
MIIIFQFSRNKIHNKLINGEEIMNYDKGWYDSTGQQRGTGI